MTRSFSQAIRSQVLVCDGGLGTMLYDRGAFVNRPFDELNLTRPDLVVDVHRAYVDAGADVIETNTFGANRPKLTSFDLAHRLTELNALGVTLARRAAPASVYVAGAIGPLGAPMAPHGRITREQAETHFREQAVALAEAGVDLFILETFRSVDELVSAVTGVRAVSDRAVVAQMVTDARGQTDDGHGPEEFGPRLVEAGATMVGLNCGVGVGPMLDAVERLEAAVEVPLSAQPNAGVLRQVDGRTLNLSSPEYLASYARRFVDHRVRLLGGCCGTTPTHIRHIARARPQPV